MTIFTLGFTQKNAEQFFSLIKENRIELLIDIRLNNRSQLAGFTKGTDLSYFLRELCGTKYVHCDEYAPTKELLSGYQKGTVSWDEYEAQYNEIMTARHASQNFAKRFSNYDRICLLCSEPTPEQCHRRLLAEILCKDWPEMSAVHL